MEDARRRERRTLWAATLTNGPAELIDFVLPLWAGIALGLGATEVGVLLAVEMALSVVVRPVAGVLADRCERRHVAGAGALLYAVSCAGYAVAGDVVVAYAAAAVGGAGGALLWVAVSAIVSERLAEDSAVFPRLLAAQETGSWVAFVAGLALLGAIGFGGLFQACAAACLAAAALLFAAPRRGVRSGAGVEAAGLGAVGLGAVGLGAVGRRLRPMLFAVVMTMAAESAVSLLLLLHLQRGFGLEVVQVAYVFLPGAIVMSVAAGRLHRYVVRFGRSRVLMAASVASCAFAVSLSWAPDPYVIAALWVLSGVAWAAVLPIQQAVIAEASGGQVGRGMGVYESACLVGGLVGSLAAGALYDGAAWSVACVVAGAMILAGAVVVPRAVRRLGVEEFPPPPPVVGEAGAGPVAGAAEVAAGPGETGADRDGGSSRSEPSQPERSQPERLQPERLQPERSGPEPSQPERSGSSKSEPPKSPARLLSDLLVHSGLFAAAQAVLALFDLSWVRDLLTRDLGTVLLGRVGRDGADAFLYGAGRVWAVVLVVDVVWTVVLVVRRNRAVKPR
ncbi:MFS transporter [Saccharothrix australiensis]|uniref:Putative MFS family arabinose efflux permease n=1 Tax=Saccharothrix australiensis TaxID=2072 RepID=A0A495W146_9PSEU|nr:MFS transporter [Saccharothrix australiensis]RKT54840.1 putative MFS family arabinose efflux permease [Saccharothrix australiensis]